MRQFGFMYSVFITLDYILDICSKFAVSFYSNFKVLYCICRGKFCRLWSGHHELHGTVGMFHLAVYDYDHKNFLVRMYDSRCCRLFSHFVPKDFLPSDDEEFRSDFASEADAERYRVSILLKRLALTSRGLSLKEGGLSVDKLIKDRTGTESWNLRNADGKQLQPQHNKLSLDDGEEQGGASGSNCGGELQLETLDASRKVYLKPQGHLNEVMSLRPQAARFWPQDLQVDVARRFGTKVFFFRFSIFGFNFELSWRSICCVANGGAFLDKVHYV